MIQVPGFMPGMAGMLGTGAVRATAPSVAERVQVSTRSGPAGSSPQLDRRRAYALRDRGGFGRSDRVTASRERSPCRWTRRTRRLARPESPQPGSGFRRPLSEARLVARGLLRAFHRLRPELREILSLAATGLSSLEIAASLSLPRPTVATRLRLARRLFARALTRSRRWPRCAR
ncbi:sigma factor-like helix-turn-helix DNA-binding protein [Sorangium sp. So ce394]|uniref:sigma factor-like helix-turn-helix DNA-binding protein n=1 Tax=Sorangium sp. So ce394 TaxID=3133310 RepID=UPI003F5B6281